MLTSGGLRNFYYLPFLHDMRCKAPRIAGIIRAQYHRDPLNGDVYIFMSKNLRRVKMLHYDNHAFYLHEKVYSRGYCFMRVRHPEDGRPVYSIGWQDLLAILETPVIKEISLG